ncbi:MAG: FKBP-type peptidyl-prolyl cis-trans isomerase [Bacteroidales bacterium]|nr:FKBP-type peptidyl-prolyl cis-trans isomerase [Bacteroidales bacterium]
MRANKKAVKTEDQQIRDFIARNHWQVIETGSGLRYRIYEEGDGEKAVKGKIAVIEYEVGLLNGETIYSTDDLGPKEFLIGKGGVESGIEEGILLMKAGDRAKFIIPSHLAFGLLGDQNKIGSKTTLVYDVKLLMLK